MAEGLGANQFDGLLKLGAGPLLATHLEYHTVVMGGSLYGKTLGNGIGQRLLAVDMLAGVAGVDGDERMPVVRRGYLDGVDIVTVQQILIELVHVAALGNALLLLPCRNTATEALALDGVDIAAGCYLHTGTLGEAHKVAASLLSQADEAEDDAVAGRYPYAVYLPAGENGERGQTERRKAEEIAPRELVAL